MATTERHPFLSLPDEVRNHLKMSLRKLYIGQLADARKSFNSLLLKLEQELKVESPLIDDLCLKLVRDLSVYSGEEDAILFLNERWNRAGTFRALVNCALLGQTVALRSKTEDLSNDVEVLLARLILASEECSARELNHFASKLEEICVDPQNEEHVLCLILSHQHLAFLFKKNCDRNCFTLHHRRALDLCKQREWDVALKLELETVLVRDMKSRGKREEVELYVDQILEAIDRLLDLDDDELELRCGLKLIREAYNDVSVACSFHELAEDRLLSTGEKLHATWEQKYGAQHHEVIFMASQLAYNYSSFYRDQEADPYLEITERELKTFPETSRLIMQAKAKTLIHVWKMYRNKEDASKAELYCREELRVNRKHGISQQYVANALRNLAFIVRDQGRGEEGLNYLKECLDLSTQHRPDLIAFQEKVQNEIKKF